MKSLCLLITSLPFFLSAQESSSSPEPTPAAEDQAAAPAKEAPQKPQYILDLESLPKEELEEYRSLLMRASALFQQKRIFECLETIEEAHAIYDKAPNSLNLQGACYVEFRNFDKARMAFAKTEKASPGSPNVRFNLAEIEFVSKNYQEALAQFEALLQEADEIGVQASMIPIMKFKAMLCRLKLDDEEGARKMIADLDFLDDSPLFYYAQAALAYYADQGAQAERWLARVSRIYARSPEVLAPWQDTLIEFGYIKSFYGADLEVEDSVIPEGPLQGE